MLTAGGARGGQRGGEGRGGQEEGGGWTRGTRRWWWWRWFQRLCPSGRSVVHVLRASLVVAVWRGVLCCSYAWAVWHSSQLISQQWKHMSIAPVTSDIAVSDCRENTHNSNDCEEDTHSCINSCNFCKSCRFVKRQQMCSWSPSNSWQCCFVFGQVCRKRKEKCLLKFPQYIRWLWVCMKKMPRKNV